ncbi:MAG: hypothetical protein ACLQLO_09965 [Mycobacterium sp.]
MSAGDDEDPPAGSADPPLTVELLADLQAGLLDDHTAARVRRQVRADPDAEATLRALNRVRGDVAAVCADPASAPDPPPAVTARISAALRSASGSSTGGAAHSARPHTRPARLIAGVAGACAVVAAIGLGTAALVNAPTPTPSTQITAEHITVSTPPMAIPLSQAQLLGLLDRSPDYGPLPGPLNDPARRASCLTGLGYPASTRVLGAQPIEINARPGVVLVLPGDTPDSLTVFAVALNCSAADTGLLVSTQIPRA